MRDMLRPPAMPPSDESPTRLETMHETWIPRLVLFIFLLYGVVLALGLMAGTSR
jgi:hypothetical protein